MLCCSRSRSQDATTLHSACDSRVHFFSSIYIFLLLVVFGLARRVLASRMAATSSVFLCFIYDILHVAKPVICPGLQSSTAAVQSNSRPPPASEIRAFHFLDLMVHTVV